jgi:hypothetical protein
MNSKLQHELTFNGSQSSIILTPHHRSFYCTTSKYNTSSQPFQPIKSYSRTSTLTEHHLHGTILRRLPSPRANHPRPMTSFPQPLLLRRLRQRNSSSDVDRQVGNIIGDNDNDVVYVHAKDRLQPTITKWMRMCTFTITKGVESRGRHRLVKTWVELRDGKEERKRRRKVFQPKIQRGVTLMIYINRIFKEGDFA